MNLQKFIMTILMSICLYIQKVNEQRERLHKNKCSH
jgi:hypothetical protein